MLGRAVKFAAHGLTGLLASCLTAMLLLAAAQILWRNAFRMAIPHAEQMLEWLVLWIAMLGAMAASAGSRHITIDALSHVLPDSARRWAGITAQFFAMVTCLVLLFITGGYWIDTMGYGETTLGGLPRWILESIVPLAFAVMAGAHCSHIISLLRFGRLAGAPGADVANKGG